MEKKGGRSRGVGVGVGVEVGVRVGVGGVVVVAVSAAVLVVVVVVVVVGVGVGEVAVVAIVVVVIVVVVAVAAAAAVVDVDLDGGVGVVAVAVAVMNAGMNAGAQRSAEYATSAPYWTAPDIDAVDFPAAPTYSVGNVALPAGNAELITINAARIQDLRFSQEVIDSMRTFGIRGFGSALQSMNRWLPDDFSIQLIGLGDAWRMMENALIHVTRNGNNFEFAVEYFVKGGIMTCVGVGGVVVVVVVVVVFY